VQGNTSAAVSGNTGLNVTAASDGSYDISYRRPLGGRSDVTYTLQRSTNLADWTTVSTVPTITSNLDGTETVKWTAAGAAGSKGFTRLKLDLAAPATTQYTCVEGWQSPTVMGQYQTVSHNFIKKPVYSCTITTASGSTLNVPVTDARDLRTYMTATKSYYVEITNGSAEGHRIDVNYAASTAQSIALNLSSPHNTTSTLPSGLDGATFLVREHVTLADIMPKASFTGGSTASAADQVQVFTNGAWGTYYLLDARPGAPTFYYWSLPGGVVNHDGLVIAPGTGVMGKHRTTTDNDTFTQVGEVRMNQFRMRVPAGTSLSSGGYPLDDSPNSRAHTIANGFFGSVSASASDQIQLWNGDTTPNSPGYGVYWLLNGNASNQFWRPTATFSNENNNTFLKAGRSQFIKRATTAPVLNLVIPRPWNP
jgi:hypothetical protein